MDFVNQKIMVNALSEKLKLININPELLNESTILRRVTINSPIDGFVSKVSIGQKVMAYSNSAPDKSIRVKLY